MEGLRVDVAATRAIVSLKETDTTLVCLAYGVIAAEAIHLDAIGTKNLHHMIGAESLVNQALYLAEHRRSLHGFVLRCINCEAEFLQYSYAYHC